jgi:hypothetical protein
MAAVDMNKLKTFLTNGKVPDISGLSTLAGTDFVNDPQFNFVTKINDLKAKKEFKWDKLGDLTDTFYGKHSKLNPADWGLPSREEVIIAGGSKASNNWDIGMVDESAKAYFQKYFGGNDPHNWALPPSDYEKWSKFMPSMENMMKDLKSFNKQKFAQLFPQYQNMPEPMQKEIMSKTYNKFKDKHEVMKKQHQISKKLLETKSKFGHDQINYHNQLKTSAQMKKTAYNILKNVVNTPKARTYLKQLINAGKIRDMKYPPPPPESWNMDQLTDLIEYDTLRTAVRGSPSPDSPFASAWAKYKINTSNVNFKANLKRIAKDLGEDHLPAGLEMYYKNMKGYDE